VLSSLIHIVVVHAWMLRYGNLNRAQGELTVLLGFVVFVVVHGVFWISGVISTEIEYRITPEETSGPSDIADNFVTRCMAPPEIIAER
jgi:hypothetical protein